MVNYSPLYQYYAYYPYSETGLNNTPSSTQTDASTFFKSGIDAFTPATDQSSASSFNSSDLQVSKATINRITASDITFDFTHSMGLAKMTIANDTKSVPTSITYNGNTGTITNQNNTNVTVSLSRSFNGNKPYYASNSNAYAYYVKPSKSTLFSTVSSNHSLSWNHTFNISSNNLDNFAPSSELVSTRTAYTIVWNYEYSGSVKELTLPSTGYYNLQVWGASGSWTWGFVGGNPGLGGYAIGNWFTNVNTKCYVCVGGYPGNPSNPGKEYNYSGGYNGGGASMRSACGGGGATHIALTNRGVLRNYENFKNEVLIVAGGGGSEDNTTDKAGDGGGEKGGNPSSTITGGTQNNGGVGPAAGIFGCGGFCVNYSDSNGNNRISYDGNYSGNQYEGGAGGGGGWYGGAGTTSAGGPAGGGSGHINTNYITDSSMKTGVRSGHGYATITLVP